MAIKKTPGKTELTEQADLFSGESIGMNIVEEDAVVAPRAGGPKDPHDPKIVELNEDDKDSLTLAPCIQLGAYNCPWENEEQMLDWYVQVRMPALAETEGGGIRIRKLASVAGWSKHAILYEFTSIEARHDYFKAHQDRPDMKPWLDWVAKNLTHAPGSSSLAQRIWPPVQL
jgi:hypothetical protein